MTRDERIANSIGWLEGFSTTVWALLSTDDGAKLVDASAGEDYDQHVRMLREALYAPECPIVDAPKIAFTAGDGE